MRSLHMWLPAILSVAFLTAFASILWRVQGRSTKDKGASTEHHSARVYRVFEFFVTVAVAIVAGLGYLRLKWPAVDAATRQAMQGLGALALFVGSTLSLFVIIHQGSKLRRWRNIEWEKLPFWLEL